MLVTYFVNFRQLNDHLFGKELFILFAASAFRKLSSIYVFSYFPFGFEGRIWDLIVSVPDHCLSFYFGVCDQCRLKPACAATRKLGRSLKFRIKKEHICLRRVFSLIIKMCSESFDFALSLLLRHVVYMKANIIMHVWSSLVYVKEATMTSTLLLALVATVFTLNNVKTISIFIVILHCLT